MHPHLAMRFQIPLAGERNQACLDVSIIILRINITFVGSIIGKGSNYSVGDVF
jgi:hypothetical protein